MAVGRVIRFDGMRGYGFIAPEQGGEDVFLHVNDLLIPEASVRSGLAVEFEVENGGRGLKASAVRFAKDAGDPPARAAEPVTGVPASGVPAAADGQEPLCDVLGPAEYTREVTELLLAGVPDLTGQQILAARRQLVLFAKRHGWIED
ncbi:cold shock domain-containing protein [Streptomyces sp. FXJ1.172]|uniref:cold-shock protein n=1 Tax=Streptomyces sp. FXJ1.172 TaxID=710705 RepID=UPI0007CF073A|nr:cold shock domain-containing protein [Streptomyces sp. FXJ1.172]WEO94156.1 cold shock domain-containing protein [Streptomyces sp. FXJ1.172]